MDAVAIPAALPSPRNWAVVVHERLAAEYAARIKAEREALRAAWPGYDEYLVLVQNSIRLCFEKAVTSAADPVEVCLYYGTCNALTAGIWNAPTLVFTCASPPLVADELSGSPLLHLAREAVEWAQSLGFQAAFRPTYKTRLDGFPPCAEHYMSIQVASPVGNDRATPE